MPLPSKLNQAISLPGGGKVSLVVGAGCSLEEPTGVPLASTCSTEIHDRLISDGVLQPGDCEAPNDLSILCDAVFDKTGRQGDVATLLAELYGLKFARANEGYRIAAALLLEGAVTSVVTLNFDLAMNAALTELGAGSSVGVIERPEQLPQQRSSNVYYIHRNANSDPEAWILRTVSLEQEWKDHWEGIVVTKVLASPVVVFAGLGSPIGVLVETTKRIRTSLDDHADLFQVDPVEKEKSKFFQLLGIEESRYIRQTWCAFMRELASRLLTDHVRQLREAASRIVEENEYESEDIGRVMAGLAALGFVECGMVRAEWLLADRAYVPLADGVTEVIADLLLAVATIERRLGAGAHIDQSGVVTLVTGNVVRATFIIASGRGTKTTAALEVGITRRRSRRPPGAWQPNSILVAGTADSPTITLPADVVRGDPSGSSIIDRRFVRIVHISQLRNDPNVILEDLA